MRLRRTILRASATTLLGLVASYQTLAQSAPQTLPPTAERAYAEVASRFDERDALSIVSFMD